ncbi:hypothetical protein CH63R_03931 [Colletotrichum higginsianum IMI 349063]|uniref:Uncharacterized protein n=1 Tax=Colletotrichum higginsianum (strain IMI 349063) TaxID=759273 RepID=A0A1B7YI05_COLHI|nr:hypothetical protein CH63R_03931 [Colletotrichum higginsianum IMI 349063]OBR11635.1 hypothetical protein CH63R_03931 [Colletotrichum higginsianum IMI 349063]
MPSVSPSALSNLRESSRIRDEEEALRDPMARDGHRDIAVPLQVVPSAATTLPITGKITGSQGQAQRRKRFQPRIVKIQTVPAVKGSKMTKRWKSTAVILEPLFAAAPCLLLCTGSPDNATITAVPVGDDADPPGLPRINNDGEPLELRIVMPPRETTHLHSVAQIEFVGFHVAQRPGESWAGGGRGALIVGSAMGFIGILVALRVLHGDWGVAYTAGAFFVALAGVLSTWIVWRASTSAH